MPPIKPDDNVFTILYLEVSTTVDIPWVTHFPLVTHVFSEYENLHDSNSFLSWTMEDFQFAFSKSH